MIKSLGSFDRHKKMNLNVKFDGINFFQLFKESPFDAFEISGENIKAMNSNFEGISIPNSGKISSLKIIPLPSRKLNVDLYFKGRDIFLSDVRAEIFGGFSSTLLKLTHESALFKFDFEKKVFHFTLKKFKRLRDLEEIIEFLICLVSGEEPLIFYIKDIIEGDITIKEREIEFLKMSPDENIAIREELLEIQQIVILLKEVQKQYRIAFRDFEFNLTEDILKILDILELHMSKDVQLINKLHFSSNDIKFYENTMNQERFVEEINTKQQQFVFESKRKVGTINLLNQEIEINDELIVKCNDAYITQVQKSSEVILNENFNVELKSANEGIKMGFLKYFNE
ncbi:hypothetical protein [Bacillus massilinigeriensis]|uniref:hypothetical protein n=1 Tax=Bacillus mediterraneensis TaxID=1805474 RepID=UPI0008F95467|nr:hypothetical protein [Bacillus mediterraneensis]